jgi:two-component system OmpR family response regulator
MKVLIAEDEQDTLELLSVFFRGKGHEVVGASDGLGTMELLEQESPDLVLLDIRMPRLNGWEVLEKVRRRRDTPVIIISALDRVDDAVRGLVLGADDYLRKPFDLSELEARVEAVLRRARSSEEGECIEVGPVQIDDRSKKVLLHGKEIKLSPREYHLLHLLVGSPGRVFGHQEIIEQVWPSENRADTSDVKQYIHLLRSKIEADSTDPRLIVTVKGFGYKFMG